MIHLPASVRVYLCLTPCDMRKSFDSLQTLVREQPEVGRFRRTPVCICEPAKGPGSRFCTGVCHGSVWRRGRTAV